MEDPGGPSGSGQAVPSGSPGLGTLSWVAPLAWLEQLLPASPMLADLRHSLPQQDEGGRGTPEPMVPDLPLQQDPPTVRLCQESELKQESSIASVPTALAAPTLSVVGEPPAWQQDQGPGCVSPTGCNFHNPWDSPLSPLEGGGGVSPEWKASGWQNANGGSITPLCPASAQAWMALSCRPEAGVLQRDQGTSVTPISVASAATYTSRLSQMDAAMNTTPAEKASTTDRTAETDSLLWHCSLDQLGSLSREELEGRLQSTLIIMEALTRQIQASQETRQAQVGPGDQRDAATQTPISKIQEAEPLSADSQPELQQRCQESLQSLPQQLESANGGVSAWSSESRQLQVMVEASFLHLQEDRRGLGRQQEQMAGLLSLCRNRLQQWGRERGRLAQELETAVKAKDAANMVLESMRSCAAAQIRTLEQKADSQQSLLSLLRDAKRWQADLSSGCSQYMEAGDRLATALQADWAQMQLNHERWRGAAAKCLLATRKMAEEVEAIRQQGTQHQEVCRQLEERTVEVKQALGRVDELTKTNAQLDQDLQAARQRAAASEPELESLREQRQALTLQLEELKAAAQQAQQEAARLAQEKERAEQDRDSAQRDLREASDCREFIEQENQVVHRQLSETEEELKGSLAALRERSAQLEDLKDAHQALRQERESLQTELTGARAELRTTEAGLEGLFWAVQEMGALRAQFLEAVDILQVALPFEVGRPGQASFSAQSSVPLTATLSQAACTPGRRTYLHLGPSLVETVLQAAAQEEGDSCLSHSAARTPGLWSDTTAFTQAVAAAPPRPPEIQAALGAHRQELRQVAGQLRLLSKQRQEEARELQAQILQMEQQRESSRQEHQAEMDACNAAQAKLSKALHLRIQNEKELRELLQQHEVRQDQLTDQWREVVALREEKAQLKLDLQKSQTEAATLWEELSGPQRPDVQEKVWLRQEAEKLKEQQLQKDAEHTEALTSHLHQVRSLEDQLHQSQQLLLQQRKLQVKLREALSVLPAEVSSLKEVQHLQGLLK